MGETDKQEQEKILTAVAYDLRLPLIQIKSSVEAAQKEEINDLLAENILSASQSGLRLIEAYLLSTALYQNYELNLEPASVGQFLEEVAHQISSTAKSYHTELEVKFPKNIQPIITNKRTAILAISCLGDSLIKAQISQNDKLRKIVISANRESGKVSVGTYIQNSHIRPSELDRLRRFTGVTQKPSSAIANHSASGIVLADKLCALISQPLKVSSRFGLRGLTTSFQKSHQIPMAF